MAADARQKEITRDLDAYISTKRKGGGLFGLFGKQETGMEEQAKPYDDPADGPAAQADVDEEAGPDAVDAAPVPSSEQEVDDAPVGEAAAAAPSEPPKKKGWFSRLFNEERPVAEAPVMAAPETDEDLREIARIALSFLRQADPAALARIKASPDFERFKEVLRKHNVIK